MIDTARLEHAAKRAARGPYEVRRRDDDNGEIDFAVVNEDCGEVAVCYDAKHAFPDGADANQAKYNAEWIAEATPETVMILVDYVKALEIKLETAKAELANLRRIDGHRRANGGAA